MVLACYPLQQLSTLRALEEGDFLLEGSPKFDFLDLHHEGSSHHESW